MKEGEWNIRKKDPGGKKKNFFFPFVFGITMFTLKTPIEKRSRSLENFLT